MSKIKDKVIDIANAVAFGMKAAGDEIMGPSEATDGGTVIQQTVQDKRVAKHLLKGELTEEVMELRYRTYAVDKASHDYKYIANGVAMKKDATPRTGKFSFDVILVPDSVLETLQSVGTWGEERYNIKVKYNCFPRFKVEQFALRINVDANEKTTRLEFGSQRDPYNSKSGPFIGEVSSCVEKGDISRRELGDSLEQLSFVTYKAVGEDDLVHYTFKGLEKAEIEFSQADWCYYLTYTWKDVERVDLTEKFFHEGMAEKYAKKEKKDAIADIAPEVRIVHCPRCGKAMSVYDADILDWSGDSKLCAECQKELAIANGTWRDETSKNQAETTVP